MIQTINRSFTLVKEKLMGRPKSKKIKNKPGSKSEPILIICIIFSILALVPVSVYIYHFWGRPLPPHAATWGTFGDYFGGVLGTLFNILGVLLIFLTFKRQEDYSHIERFETTFFNLLDNQREIVKSLSGFFWEPELAKNVKVESYSYITAFSNELAPMVNKVDDISNYLACQKEISAVYLKVYERIADQLGHYFRHLYHIVKYTDESDVKDKKKYIDIVQAQMNNNELYCVFYNSISDLGIKRLLPLLKEYQFFENITSKNRAFDLHASLFYTETNFKSKTPDLDPPLNEIS